MTGMTVLLLVIGAVVAGAVCALAIAWAVTRGEAPPRYRGRY